MRQVARGVSGRLMAGADVAAALGAWSLAVADEAMGDTAWTCTAETRTRDDFLLAHGAPFRLRLDMGAGAWSWRGVAVEGGRTLVVKGNGDPEEG